MLGGRAFLLLLVTTALGGCAEQGGGGAAQDAAADSAPSHLDYDCENMPQGPFELVPVTGPVASEDLAFDGAGHVVTNRVGTPGILKTAYRGEPEVFSPNIRFRAGMRYLPSGDLVVANNETGSIVRIDPKGVEHVVLSGLSYPNGITVDLSGLVYFSESSGNRIHRLDPLTGEDEIFYEIEFPNGLSFDPNYRILYVASFPGLWRLPLEEDGSAGEIAFVTNIGSGIVDGVAVDACGNVYVCSYGDGTVFRVSEDGADVRDIIVDQGRIPYLPNLDWGSGVGGWDPMALYLPEGVLEVVMEMRVGVPTKPRPFP